MAGFPIGEVAKQTGIKVPTIRYYEQIGLLPVPARSHSNRRVYTRSDLQRLGFIRHARELGFEIEAIRTFLRLQDDPNQPCDIADSIAKARLIDVEQRIRSLTALKTELELMVQGCHRGHVADCRVIEVLADHGKCAQERH